jgi:hypothetical protein
MGYCVVRRTTGARCEIVEEIWRSNSEETIADPSDILTN